jgi:hypothetical protein
MLASIVAAPGASVARMKARLPWTMIGVTRLS